MFEESYPFSGLDHAAPTGRKPQRDPRLCEFDDVTLVDEIRARCELSFIALAQPNDDGTHALAVAIGSNNPIALRLMVQQAIIHSL